MKIKFKLSNIKLPSLVEEAIEEIGLLKFGLMVITAIFSGASFFALMILLGSL